MFLSRTVLKIPTNHLSIIVHGWNKRNQIDGSTIYDQHHLKFQSIYLLGTVWLLAIFKMDSNLQLSVSFAKENVEG